MEPTETPEKPKKKPGRKPKSEVKAIGFIDFCEQVLKVKFTVGQKVIAKLAYDKLQPSDLTDKAEIKYCQKIFGDIQTIPDSARRIVALVAGRGSGKSSILAACRLLHLALTVPLTQLAPGEIASALIVCPDLKTAKQTLRFAKGRAKSVPTIAARIGNKNVERSGQVGGDTQDSFIIRRPDGEVSIECLAASRGGAATRGRSFVGAVLDECAFFYDEEHAVNDKEIFMAILPRLMPGAQIIVSSTPWSDSGLLYDFYRENFGNPVEVLVAHAPTLLLQNTEDNQKSVVAMEKMDPDRAKREFWAEFQSGLTSSWFDATAVDNSIDVSRHLSLPYKADTLTVVGADLAFKQDSSAIVTVQYFNGLFHVADIKEKRPTIGNPLKFSEVAAEVAGTLKDYKVDFVMADRYSEAAFREYLETNDLALVNIPDGQDGKVEMYGRAKTLFREGLVRIPEHHKLVNQLKQVTGRPTSGGKIHIELPRVRGAGHGDIVSALVAALWKAYQLSLGLEKELRQGTYQWYQRKAEENLDEYERMILAETNAKDEDVRWKRAGMGISHNDPWAEIDWDHLRKMGG